MLETLKTSVNHAEHTAQCNENWSLWGKCLGLAGGLSPPPPDRRAIVSYCWWPAVSECKFSSFAKNGQY